MFGVILMTELRPSLRPAYDISMIIDCKSVAKLRRNLIACVKILNVVLCKLTYSDNNRAKAPEVLLSDDNYKLLR